MKISKKQKQKKSSKQFNYPSPTLIFKKKASGKLDKLDKVKSVQNLHSRKSKDHSSKNMVINQDSRKLQTLKQKYLSKKSNLKESAEFLLNEQQVEQRNHLCLNQYKQKNDRNRYSQSPSKQRTKDILQLRKKISFESKKQYNTLTYSNSQWKYPPQTNRINYHNIKQNLGAEERGNSRFRNSSQHSQKSYSLKESSRIQSAKKLPQVTCRPKRFKKFEFRSQKYIRLSSELQLEHQHKQNQKYTDEYKKIEGICSSQQLPTSPSSKNYRKNNGQTASLQKQMSYYKTMTTRSQKVLNIMQTVLSQQKQKLASQRKLYKQQITRLKQRIEQRKLKINIGHLFSYKQFDISSLIPAQIIMQRSEFPVDTLDSSNPDMQQLRRKGQQIIEYYENVGGSVVNGVSGNTDNTTVDDGLDLLSVNSRQ